MAAATVPANRSIRRNRVHNIESPRLIARLHVLLEIVVVEGGRNLPGINPFVMRTAELAAIEGELVARGAMSAAQVAAGRNAAMNRRMAMNGGFM